MPEASGHRLDAILRALPASELASLTSRLGIRIDPGKRIDMASQVARVLVGNADIREPSRLSPSSRELLHRIAEAGGVLRVPLLPSGLEPLIARGVVFGKRLEKGFELVLPTAYLIQMKSWEGEHPRALRALIAQAPLETMSAIASHYRGRPATPPIALSMEAAWEILSDPSRVAAELERLAPAERRLLEAIDSVGGEVDTQELLDLEREPMRLRGVGGVTATRRGAGFSLERRAFLMPIHPNRHVIPVEVARLVGAVGDRERETSRAAIRSFVLSEDHVPRRARFANDPAFLAIAMAFAVREASSDVRPGVGTPRALLLRIAQRVGRDVEAVALMAALSRAIGLWDASASSLATPPGSLTLADLGRLLFTTWRSGGAWDEARTEPEVLRAAEGSRDPSPIGSLREMVLEALHELGEGRWVPWNALEGYLAIDARIAGAERLLRRWADRCSLGVPEAFEITRRIALETLPALGIIDLGGAIDDLPTTRDAADDGVTPRGPMLRLTPRGRALLSGVRPLTDEAVSAFVDGSALSIGASANVATVLALAPFSEVGRVGDQLDLVLSPASIARALSTGLDPTLLRSRLAAVAPLPEPVARMVVQASAVIGRASFVASSGFLWIDDPEVRELLRTRRPASELFLDPSPPSGLLIGADVERERLVRRCRSLGVEIEEQGVTLRARSSMMPPAGKSLAPSARSGSPPSKSTAPERGTARPRGRTLPPSR